MGHGYVVPNQKLTWGLGVFFWSMGLGLRTWVACTLWTKYGPKRKTYKPN